MCITGCGPVPRLHRYALSQVSLFKPAKPNPNPHPDQVLFFKPAGSEERGGYGGVKLVALDLSKHPSYRSLLRFDGPDWRHHLASLKPLGLCSVLNSTCRHDDCGEMVSTQLQAAFLRMCMCMCMCMCVRMCMCVCVCVCVCMCT